MFPCPFLSCSSQWFFTSLFVIQQLYRKKPGLAITFAKLPQNLDKNRYKDVLPCEYPVWIPPTFPPLHTEIMFPFLKQIVWYSGLIFRVSVNTTVFIAAIWDSEQLGNSVYANEARAADGAGNWTLVYLAR